MFLKFGIPSLDELIQIPHPEKRAEPSVHSESIAILGPEGTGKSILALHLASRYTADCIRRLSAKSTRHSSKGLFIPKILYISSDLKAASAKDIWETFKLDIPNRRQIPFERNMEGILRSAKQQKDLRVELKPLWLSAMTTDDLVDEVLIPKLHSTTNAHANVSFLDLASHTAGDDWSLVNALLVKLQAVSSTQLAENDQPLPHLVIIDSVAGFETFVGKIDAYGTEHTRRSRIAQCLRNSGQRVSIIFVVEEGLSSEHLPEEYVTDVVISLRKRTLSSNTILTLEVEKARAHEHAKGEHPFEIRDRNGTSTGQWESLDAPLTGNSYVQVFPSIAHRNYIVSADWVRPDLPIGTETAGFGVPYLDELLPTVENDTTKDRVRGLRAGTVTALIGDSATSDLWLMRRIDELHLEYPFAGSRMLRDLLSRQGLEVGRRHVKP